MTALLWIIQRIAGLPIVSTGRSGGGAHLLVVAGQVDLVHGGGMVAQMLRGRRVRVGSKNSRRQSRRASGLVQNVVSITQWLAAYCGSRDGDWSGCLCFRQRCGLSGGWCWKACGEREKSRGGCLFLAAPAAV